MIGREELVRGGEGCGAAREGWGLREISVQKAQIC
jgi:hypothetical protein